MGEVGATASGQWPPHEPREVRYEVLPFASAEQAAAAVVRPLTLTVTCSPKHGPDHTIAVGSRLRGIGHRVVVHLAARMVRGRSHLDALLDSMAAAGIADVFLVGGDAREPAGPYASALALLPELRSHELAPHTIGVPAYPEGHPLIPPAVLREDLLEKGRLADYLTTQMCFDPDALLGWIEQTRAAGIAPPAYVGVPGAVDRRRLLEVSLRVGVGASISFVRKQRGAPHLFGRGRSTAAICLTRLRPRSARRSASRVCISSPSTVSPRPFASWRSGRARSRSVPVRQIEDLPRSHSTTPNEPVRR